MFLKNLQMTRNTLITSLLLLSQAAMITKSYSLDLKVDLPPDAGKEPVLYYNPIVNQQADTKSAKVTKNKEEPDNKKQQKIAQKPVQTKQEAEDDLSYTDEEEDVPPPPPSLASEKNKSLKKEILTTSQEKKTISKARQMRDASFAQEQEMMDEVAEPISSKDPFPMLSCIEDNVKFWGRVYTEIDVNEAFLHDKNDLSRVYASVTLPQGKAQRSAFMDNERLKYTKILDDLSKKIKLSPKKWTKEERKISKLFKKNELTSKNLQEAKANLRFQTGIKSQFEAGVQRSINYLPSVYPIVKQSGLPIELALLPHVESSYNSKAGSKVGAMGLWQIMPGTMRMIEGAAAVSKRTDPTISTRAAMKILKSDYAKIQNWPLTLTAYNHGVNGMLRAIDETGSRDLCKVIDHYSSPSFQFASSNFYAQFLAARKAAMKKYAVLAKKGKGESSLVLRRTVLSTKGGSLK
jgi:membrane-bound lytic murein transglycosylase D